MIQTGDPYKTRYELLTWATRVTGLRGLARNIRFLTTQGGFELRSAYKLESHVLFSFSWELQFDPILVRNDRLDRIEIYS